MTVSASQNRWTRPGKAFSPESTSLGCRKSRAEGVTQTRLTGQLRNIAECDPRYQYVPLHRCVRGDRRRSWELLKRVMRGH